jgi:putative colanic acid biosynthesis UDP-glucose lipid carrier transferase
MHDLIEKSATRVEYLARASDVLLLYLSGQLAAGLIFPMALADTAPIHLALLYFCCALAYVLFPQFDLYSSWRGRSWLAMGRQIALALLVVLSSAVLFSFLIRQIEQLSRLWVGLWCVLSFAAIISSRGLLYAALSLLRERGLNHKRVIIVGYGETGRELHRRARQQQWIGYTVVAIFNKDCGKPPEDQIEVLSELGCLPDAAARHGAHEVWITLPLAQSSELQQLQYLLRNALVDIRWAPDVAAMRILSHRAMEFLGLPVVELNHAPAAGVQGIAKDLFDRLFSLTVLMLLTPLLLALALAVKCSSPGPILFRQPRLGLNGRCFNVYKFRSMALHQEQQGQLKQATRDDPRITPIGRFMRRTSLDELPQFFNVLKGEMSVVGPRPHALPHNDLYKDKLSMYMQRHRVKPGITGWAQICGSRGETDTDEKMARRIALDLHYIQHWSLWMDIKIVLWTAFKGWTDKNAY